MVLTLLRITALFTGGWALRLHGVDTFGVKQNAACFTYLDLTGAGHQIAALQRNGGVAIAARPASQRVKRLIPLPSDSVVLPEHWLVFHQL